MHHESNNAISDSSSDTTFNGSDESKIGFSKYNDPSGYELSSFSNTSPPTSGFSSFMKPPPYEQSKGAAQKIFKSHLSSSSDKNSPFNDKKISTSFKNDQALHRVINKQSFSAKQTNSKKPYTNNTRISELIIQETKPEFIDNYSEMNANSIIRYSNKLDSMDMPQPQPQIHSLSQNKDANSRLISSSCGIESNRSLLLNPLVNFENNPVFYHKPERRRKSSNFNSSLITRSFNNPNTITSAPTSTSKKKKNKADQKFFINALRKWATSQAAPVENSQINLMGRSDPEQISKLVDSGMNFNSIDEHSRTALHVACSLGNIKAVEMLLGYGSDPNSVDVVGNTPLNIAAIAGHTEIVLLLLQFGADPRAGRQRLSPSAMVRLRLKQLRAQIKRNKLLIKPPSHKSPSISELDSDMTDSHDSNSGSNNKSRSANQFKASRSKAYMISQECFAILRILQYYVNADIASKPNLGVFDKTDTQPDLSQNSSSNNRSCNDYHYSGYNNEYIDPSWVAFDNKDESIMPVTNNVREAFNELASQLENFQLSDKCSKSEPLNKNHINHKTFNTLSTIINSTNHSSSNNAFTPTNTNQFHDSITINTNNINPPLSPPPYSFNLNNEEISIMSAVNNNNDGNSNSNALNQEDVCQHDPSSFANASENSSDQSVHLPASGESNDINQHRFPSSNESISASASKDSSSSDCSDDVKVERLLDKLSLLVDSLQLE
ncbi:Ankyrin repeat domain-containing protein 54 [Smittium culicis]|uniref:Ankyrin repeat domain-containing protein 54 n=1 Tax=Smittium culicis TaxID=133412 RepID=A0A1R1YKJ9_9FUNG|nr:Ankyrin repeat domain-containing protein 54 [Smittium culicis]